MTSTQAKELCKGNLPKAGYEKLVVSNDNHYWLSRTMHNGVVKWYLRETQWRLVGNVARL
jgi:hypothetical protein